MELRMKFCSGTKCYINSYSDLLYQSRVMIMSTL